MYTRLCHSGSSYSIIIKLPSLPHLQSLLLATFLAKEEEKVDLQLLKATFCLFVCLFSGYTRIPLPLTEIEKS